MDTEKLVDAVGIIGEFEDEEIGEEETLARALEDSKLGVPT